MDIQSQAKERAVQWLNNPLLDEESRKEIQRLLTEDGREITDRFYKNLEFGTGGLRGIMGIGSNCMNRYTVGMATQGLANYLQKCHRKPNIKVAVAHDSRNNSRYFAEVTAGVLAANGIEVWMFPELRPTPLLSFAVRHLSCDAGIMITASHNPPDYNGYKVYWNDGAQIVSPHDVLIVGEINRITDFREVKFEGNPSLIHTIGPEVEEAYFRKVVDCIPQKHLVRRHGHLPLVYSSLHGAGITMVPRCLEQLGFSNVSLVEEQSQPDGNFPTVHSPNPEEESAMKMTLQKAALTGAALAMATDPDTDRVGIGIRKPDGTYMLLNGNQALSLMIGFILSNLSEEDRKIGFIAKTIVTTELVDAIARYYQVNCYNTLTGFKYIATIIREREGKEKFIAAGEESYGYMVGDFVRDKDAVSACAFFAAMAALAESQKQSLYDWLLNLYVRFGFYREGLINLTKKGQQGEAEMRALMEKLRSHPPDSIGGQAVVRVLDYLKQIETDHATGKVRGIDLPASDVLQFYLNDGTKISVRPSGTEPKIKFYISVQTSLPDPTAFDVVNRQLGDKINHYAGYLMEI
jgi:phosphoglucomutase